MRRTTSKTSARSAGRRCSTSTRSAACSKRVHPDDLYVQPLLYTCLREEPPDLRPSDGRSILPSADREIPLRPPALRCRHRKIPKGADNAEVNVVRAGSVVGENTPLIVLVRLGLAQEDRHLVGQVILVGSKTPAINIAVVRSNLETRKQRNFADMMSAYKEMLTYIK
mgnify:CR=1 FL=1